MRLETVESIDPIVWDASIALFGGSIFHSSTWADFTVAGSPRDIPQYISLLSDDGCLLGACLGFLAFSQTKIIGRLFRRLRLDALPLSKDSDPEILERYLRYLENQARRCGFVELSIGSFASLDASATLKKLGRLNQCAAFRIHGN